jgi:hypothetical protein
MRLPKLLKTAIPLAALAVLAVAGCGGGGSDSTSTAAATTETTALSKAELISQGDSICGEVNAAVGSAGGSEAEAAQQAIQVSDLYVGMVESIKRLGAPAESAGYAEFIEAAEELSEVEGEVKLAAEREDTVALEEATTKAAPALEEFQTQAAVYGFKDCSEGPHAPTPSGSGTAPAEEAEEGGVEVAPEEVEEEAPVEEATPEEVAPETGGAGGAGEEAAPESGGGETGGSSGGVGPG